MAEALDLASRFVTRDLKPLEGFGPSFSGAQFDAAGTMPHALLGDEREEQREVAGFDTAQRAGTELVVDVYGVLETPRARHGVVIGGGLCHQHTDQVVGGQMGLQLFLDHGRR